MWVKIIFGKDEQIKSYEDFWNWFQRNEKVFFNVVKEKGNVGRVFFDKLSPKLKEIKEGIYYLTGMSDSNTAELVFTAEGCIKNFLFVEEIVHSAPKMDGWLFTALKPAIGIENVNIEMDGCQFNGRNINFYTNENEEYPDQIDVTIVHDEFNEANKSIITNGTYIFLDNFLGELNFASTVDKLIVTGKENAKKDLIPIGKLKDYLIWREKEFVEKYEGVRHNTQNDNYSVLSAELESGNKLIAVINTDLLAWDCKASHPWILSIEIIYKAENNYGLPDEATYKLLDEIEEDVSNKLKDSQGYLNVGRETSNGVREIYFACKDFRLPSKVVNEVEHKYCNRIRLSYDIYKDKYWRSFNRFVRSIND